MACRMPPETEARWVGRSSVACSVTWTQPGRRYPSIPAREPPADSGPRAYDAANPRRCAALRGRETESASPQSTQAPGLTMRLNPRRCAAVPGREIENTPPSRERLEAQRIGSGAPSGGTRVQNSEAQALTG